MKRSKLLGPTISVMGFTLLSNVLGFGRESFIAYAYGANGSTDTYYVASLIPTMLAGWIGFTMTNTLIPQLREELRISKISAKRLVSAVFWVTCLALVVIVLLVLVGRQLIITELAPGFRLMQHEEAAHLLIIMLGATVVSGLCGILAGVYEAENQFSYPMITTVLNNAVFILVAVICRARLGILALAYGYVVGMMVNFILLWFPLRLKSRTMFMLRFRHSAMMNILRASPPIFASYGVGTVNLIVDRILASGLPAGQITDLNFASKLGLVPGTLIGMSIATTLYAKFVTFHLDRNIKALRVALLKGLYWTTFSGMVVASAFICFGRSLVSVLFAHGAFQTSDVQLTTRAIHVYGAFAIFYLLPPILGRFFYARKENRFVLWASVFAVSINISGSLLLVHHLGLNGLVVANGLSQVAIVGTLMVNAVRRIRSSLRSIIGDVITHAVPPGGCVVLGVYTLAIFWHEPSQHQVELLVVRPFLALLFGGGLLLIYMKFAPEKMVRQFVGEFSRWVRRGT